MSNGPTKDPAGDVETWLVDAIEQLPGVIAASAWIAEPKRLQALHITATPNAAPKIIAHAAAKILRRQGIAFEQGMIQVGARPRAEEQNAEVGVQSAPASPAPTSDRFLLLHDLTVQRTGSRVSCRVVLQRQGVEYEGEATELDTEAGRVRAAARATLAAAEHAGEQLALGLEGTLLLDLFGRQYVAASVEAAVERRFALLAGLVPIDSSRSPEEAACLAALRAVDRWLAI